MALAMALAASVEKTWSLEVLPDFRLQDFTSEFLRPLDSWHCHLAASHVSGYAPSGCFKQRLEGSQILRVGTTHGHTHDRRQDHRESCWRTPIAQHHPCSVSG